jgi:hypothetical protein
MHELKCDLCSAKVYAFSPRAAAELLEEHMEGRHSRTLPPIAGEDHLRLTEFDAQFLTSMRIGW